MVFALHFYNHFLIILDFYLCSHTRLSVCFGPATIRLVLVPLSKFCRHTKKPKIIDFLIFFVHNSIILLTFQILYFEYIPKKGKAHLFYNQGVTHILTHSLITERLAIFELLWSNWPCLLLGYLILFLTIALYDFSYIFLP